MQKEIEKRCGVTKDQVLHVRSFIDHDRPFILPTRKAPPALLIAIESVSDGAYTQAEGKIVTPSDVFCSLVEHLERWKACMGKYGLLVLEVSLLPVPATTKYMREATSLHFDSCQATIPR